MFYVFCLRQWLIDIERALYCFWRKASKWMSISEKRETRLMEWVDIIKETQFFTGRYSALVNNSQLLMNEEEGGL